MKWEGGMRKAERENGEEGGSGNAECGVKGLRTGRRREKKSEEFSLLVKADS